MFFYIFLFLLFSTPGKSQKKCGTENKRFEALARNPGLIKERQIIEAFTKNWIEKDDAAKSGQTVVKIPVVVHVVWRTAAQNISDEQIKSQIDILNKDFRKLNSDANKTPAFLRIL